jgi:hypothetical protein
LNQAVRNLITACSLLVAVLAGPGCVPRQSAGPTTPGATTAEPGSEAPSGTLSTDPTLTSDDALVKLLGELGISEVNVMETGKILFTVNDSSMALFRFPDGDLQLFYGVGGVRCPLEAINEWNKQHRHSRAYLDDESDPVLESDLLSDGGMSQDKLTVFVRAFQMSAGEFQSLLIQHCTSVQGRDA